MDERFLNKQDFIISLFKVNNQKNSGSLRLDQIIYTVNIKQMFYVACSLYSLQNIFELALWVLCYYKLLTIFQCFVLDPDEPIIKGENL